MVKWLKEYFNRNLAIVVNIAWDICSRLVSIAPASKCIYVEVNVFVSLNVLAIVYLELYTSYQLK